MDEKQPSKIRVDAVRLLLSRGFGNPPEEIRVETSPELMRAGELRKVLKEEGLLTNPPQPVAAIRPDLKAWLNGDLDDPNSPA